MSTRHDRHWILVTIVILFLGIVWIWVSVIPPDETTSGAIPAPQEGFQAPDFTLSTLDSQIITLSDLRGKAILLNFWATWCPPCRSEMPAMQTVYKDYGSSGKFVILAVNSTLQDRMEDVGSFVVEQGLTFPVLLDTDGEVSNLYQVRSMPTSFFIDPDGIIREVVIGGPMSEALLRTRIDRLSEENH